MHTAVLDAGMHGCMQLDAWGLGVVAPAPGKMLFPKKHFNKQNV